MRQRLLAGSRLALGLCLLTAARAQAMTPKAAPALPPPSGTVVNVSTDYQLRTAINNAATGSTIMIADGTYYMTSPQSMHLNGKSDVTIRGASGDPTKVILRGYGFSSQDSNDIPIIISNCHNILIADVTFTEAGANGLHLQGETNPTNIHVYNCHFKDIGERQIKGSGGSGSVVGGSIRFCRFENTKIPPETWLAGGNYITSIDMMALDGWEFSDNYFKNIKGATGSARAAIFVWQNSRNITVKRNVIIDCDRGIAFGNPGSTTMHVSDSSILNNFIVPGPDAGIELWYADNIKIYNNTIWRKPEDVLLRGVRGGSDTLPLTNIDLKNNIIRGRDLLTGGITRANNYFDGVDGYFVNAAAGNLRLTENATGVIDQGQQLTEVTEDYDGVARGTQTDIGASEYVGGGPVADAGPDLTAYTGEQVALDGTGSSGQSGLTYAWVRNGGTGPAVTLTGANTATATFSPTATGTYTFRLTVTDASGSDQDNVTVTVLGVLAAAGPDREVSPGAQVLLDGSGSRGVISSYAWSRVGGDDPGPLTGASTAQASFTAGSKGMSYDFRLTVTGPSGTSNDLVTITVGALSSAIDCSQHLQVRGAYSSGVWTANGTDATSTAVRTLGRSNYDDYSELLLMRFSLGSLPDCAAIQSATLMVYCHDDYDPRGAMARVFGLNQAWTSAATYLTRDGANAWSGGRVVTSMDAAWTDQQINNATATDEVGTPNPDYTDAAYPAGDNWTGRWIEFDVTGIVTAWDAGSRTNHGLVLASANYSQAEGGAKVNWGYTAMQWRTSTHETDKPRLVVTYREPVSFDARDPVNFINVTPDDGLDGTVFAAAAAESQSLAVGSLGMGAADPEMGSLTLTITETGGTYNGSNKPSFPSPVSNPGNGTSVTRISSAATMSGNFDGYGTIVYTLSLEGDYSNATGTLTLTVAEFVPGVTPPVVTAAVATSIVSTSATLNGSIVSTGGENPAVTLRWGTSAGALVNTVVLGVKPAGAFQHDLGGLTAGTTYYYRFSATNSAGVADSAIVSFMTEAGGEDDPPGGGGGGCAPAGGGVLAPALLALLAGVFVWRRGVR